MAGAVKPSSWEIEWRPRPVCESKYGLIEMHRLFEFPGRYIVMVKHTNAHFHQVSPGTRAWQSDETVSVRFAVACCLRRSSPSMSRRSLSAVSTPPYRARHIAPSSHQECGALMVVRGALAVTKRVNAWRTI